jgi:predicted ATP-dependent protease
LDGTQGVLIPASNARDLMLRREVVRAIAEGKFHVWTVETVAEGIALLTGIEAGERDANGRFPPDSIHARAAQRLEEFARMLRHSTDALGEHKRANTGPVSL